METSDISPASVKRGRDLISKLERTGLADPEVVLAYETMINPCPDKQIRPIGLPSNNTQPTTKIKATFNYSMSNRDLPSGATWDAHVVLTPFLGKHTGAEGTYTVTSLGSTVVGACSAKLSPLMIVKGESGANLTLQTDAMIPGVIKNYYDDVTSLVKGQPFRIVSQGIELQNTTPELYKAGVIHAYSASSQAYQQPTFVETPAPIPKYFVNYSNMSRCPVNQQTAANLPTYYVGQAEDGFYGINLPNDICDHPFRDHMPTVLLSYQGLNNANSTTTFYGFSGVGAYTNMSWTGAFLLNLTPETTFNVRVTTYIEVLPTDNMEFLSFSTPPVMSGGVMTDIMNESIRTLPVGMSYVNGNPFGEWFKRFLSTVGEVGARASPVLAAINPFVGAAASSLSALATHYGKKEKPQHPPQAPPKPAHLKGAILKKAGLKKNTQKPMKVTP